jgi:hypothetical protein
MDFSPREGDWWLGMQIFERRRAMASALKNWLMVVLTLVFVLLYGAALLGKLRPLTDLSVVARLEPIIFVIIGYYFGRLPAQQNEETLKEEISRQIQRSDAAQHAKEQALQAREMLDEKVKNVKAVLAPIAPNTPVKGLIEHGTKEGGPANEEAIRHSIATALGILNT